MSSSADAVPVVSQLSDIPHSDVQTAEQHKSRNAQTDSVRSDAQQHSPAEPREHRRPKRPGIVWAVGSRLEARDFLNKWYILLCTEEKIFRSFGLIVCSFVEIRRFFVTLFSHSSVPIAYFLLCVYYFNKQTKMLLFPVHSLIMIEHVNFS